MAELVACLPTCPAEARGAEADLSRRSAWRGGGPVPPKRVARRRTCPAEARGAEANRPAEARGAEADLSRRSAWRGGGCSS